MLVFNYKKCDIRVWMDLFKPFESYMNIIELIFVIFIAYILFSLILTIFKRNLLKKVKRKKQVANVIEFFGLIKFIFVIFLLIVIFIAYYGSWGDIGFIAGLLTIALVMSLQKPISGIFAWLIIITRKPFSIGDRVIISQIKGDITDITLTHIYLEEVCGTYEKCC